MRISRHNGRSGKHGAYNPKHNDREFNLENSSHIDPVRALENVYWDYVRGYRFPKKDKPDGISFEQIEIQFYEETFGETVRNQNARNERNRHPERNRTVEDLYRNDKTCPEETIYQIGNMEKSINGADLKVIINALLDEIEKRYGSHMFIIDMALHMDEATPHIHERHVFYAKNRNGEFYPLQEQALKEMGVPLPDPKKPQGQYNNRKMTFDAECRKIFIRICKSHGLDVEEEAIYGGQEYLEKNDYILEKQKKALSEIKKQTKVASARKSIIEEKVNEADELVDEICDIVYEVAGTELVVLTAKETRHQDYCAFSDYYSNLLDVHKEPEKKSFLVSIMKPLMKFFERPVQSIVDLIKYRAEEDYTASIHKDDIKEKVWKHIEDKAKKEQERGQEESLAQTLSRKRGRGR